MKFSVGQGCFGAVLLMALLVSVQIFQSNPIPLYVMVLLILTWIVASILVERSSAKRTLIELERQATMLDELVASDFKVTNAVFAEQKDEVVIYHLQGVTLSEYKSSGSTYSGGYAGVSFRVLKGVRFNTGRTGGTSTRNPETPQDLDTGALTVTNQRVVFTGANQVRVFDLDKVINMEAGPNGFSVAISVSNRERTSTLAAQNLDDLTPGIVVSIAAAWHDGGKPKAIEDAKLLATQIRAVVAEQRAKTSR